MPENFTNIMLFILFGGIGALALIRIIIKQIQNRFAPIKTVRATVINKQKNQTFNKYSGNGKHEKYVVVFSIDGKKKSFYVSQFSYGGYRINESGTLTYKGNKLIGFQ
ncbi:MAG: DUF2500 domain-containing protein [Oscillospiraceae bacterium]|nr:DUF2500 domain-containing protein [Oscillospiraceae bacterium]